MAESSFRKGLNFGCGLIAALVFVFVVLPVGCLVFFYALGSDGADARTDSGRVTSPPEATPPPGERQGAEEEVLTLWDCGRLVDGRDANGNPRPPSWADWECAAEVEVGDRWDRCLGRREYTPVVGRGCPGALRCCPPAEAAAR